MGGRISWARVSYVCLFRGHFWMELGWPFWGGGCGLTRDTRGLLVKAAELDGGWAEIILETVDEWSVVPHIVGYFVKRS